VKIAKLTKTNNFNKFCSGTLCVLEQEKETFNKLTVLHSDVTS